MGIMTVVRMCRQVVFTGTVRFNLDPTGAYSDDRLWAAVTAVGLRPVVEAMQVSIGTDIVWQPPT
jgi:hypothetical protein